jgi:hypothetical protein
MVRAAPNRTDLLTPMVPTSPAPGQGQPNGQPIQTPTGLPYGEAGMLQQAQAAVPVPQAPGPPPPGAPAPGAPPQDPMAAARNYQMPSLGALNRPTERPNEPVTAGLPGGLAAAGPPPQAAGTIAAMLTKMSVGTGSSALASLAQRAQAIGQ